ncbi:succinate dehydrogenase cytochrome b556 subunit [Candidatus Photodesmus katoptron]|uniref:Succinate dehydrogenase cytochrome b556 subunit n=1 Tax=Candidatus Photodesmus katoptron Akat1 TaxID=1236703 RepID=S3DGS1_9GAMM|nr:succinate dehydrogenase cytochrome b556 large membrane subunit [Candidatus Photodesmus katoptron Akat1]KEY90613.1 succinate dehydrogenase cytochrome b556 subunit [Candidatus Photodesmus katoptron]
MDLKTIKFPITAIVSILHRVSGIVMFFFLGVCLWLLLNLLKSPSDFLETRFLFENYLVKFVFWVVFTTLTYHVIAGIRHFLMDLGYFDELKSSILSAKITIFITTILSSLLVVILW